MNANPTVGQRIRDLRLGALLTQKALAAKLGVETMTVSRWERDDVPPSDLNRVRLGRFFNVNPNEFRPTFESEPAA